MEAERLQAKHCYKKLPFSLSFLRKNNRYRHPSIETVGRLNGIHAHIFRTDQDGQIRLDFRKEQIEISTKLLEKRQN